MFNFDLRLCFLESVGEDLTSFFYQASGHQKMTRNQSDHRALLDLVFGNVEMAFRGDCLRIHCTT